MSPVISIVNAILPQHLSMDGNESQHIICKPHVVVCDLNIIIFDSIQLIPK